MIITLTKVITLPPPPLLKPYPSDMPVMVLIHGGGFLVGGSEEQYPPMPLLKRDVVLVVLQYRLGTLGQVNWA